MSIASTILEHEIPQKRRVFFSFHYQNDIWRVNQVRNSWRYQKEQDRFAEGFFDASIWERSQRNSPDSLKNLIREGLRNTSVTCVLSGSETYNRRWVRYEIAQSIIKGNGLLVVNIHNLKNNYGHGSLSGPNPLSCMGAYHGDDGRILLAVKQNDNWVKYQDYTQAITLPNGWTQPKINKVIPFNRYTKEYCYAVQNGHINFPNWVRSSLER